MLKIINERDTGAFLSKLKSRGDNSAVESVVRDITDDVKKNGDEAVKRYTAKLDCESPKYYRVPDEVIENAYNEADKEFINALTKCSGNISKFHERQKREGFAVTEENGVITGQRVRPIERAGIYVPGGTAAYPSSLLMNAIPAKIAGVKEIIAVTPPCKDGCPNSDILAAARLCGVSKIFLCGGAQAVAALAYGTEEIPKVDKITGPGNVYVTAAKKLLYGVADIDMVAGPSEILIIADKSANPAYIAADLLSQAEHDEKASAVLVTDCAELAEKVCAELSKQILKLPRKAFTELSLSDYGAAIIVPDMARAVEIAEIIAPEHCEVLAENPLEYIGKINNVGSLFLGEYSPEPLGDYYAGPNHVLPTNFTARFFSPLGVDSFLKRSSYIYYTKDALNQAADIIVTVAEREGLTAHANAVKIRRDDKNV